MANDTKKNGNLEALITGVEKAEQALATAKEKLEAGLSEVPNGHAFFIDNVPYQVLDVDGKKKISCMWSKRAIALSKGLPLPEIQKRRPRAAKAAE